MVLTLSKTKTRSEKLNKKIANVDLSEEEETFVFEFTSYKKVRITAAIGAAFGDLKNHFGDIDELNNILIENEWKPEFKKSKEDINLFKRIIKLGFEHVGKSCNDELSKTFHSSDLKVNIKLKIASKSVLLKFMIIYVLKIVSNNPFKFTVNNSSLVYSVSDFFVKYFKFIQKSVSRRTCKPVIC